MPAYKERTPINQFDCEHENQQPVIDTKTGEILSWYCICGRSVSNEQKKKDAKS